MLTQMNEWYAVDKGGIENRIRQIGVNYRSALVCDKSLGTLYFFRHFCVQTLISSVLHTTFTKFFHR